jgi:hypothetical protein
MTIFAIRPLSSCVKALGVFEVRRSGRLGEPPSDENYGNSQLETLINLTLRGTWTLLASVLRLK